MSTVANLAMKCSLNVALAHLAALTLWLWGGDKVDVHVILADVRSDNFGAFVVHHVECGVILACGKSGKDISEGIDHGAIVLGGHSMHKDGIEVIHIGNKNILH